MKHSNEKVCVNGMFQSAFSHSNCVQIVQIVISICYGVVQKWCHAFVDNFWPPYPRWSRVLLLRPVYCCHKILDPLPLQDRDVILCYQLCGRTFLLDLKVFQDVGWFWYFSATCQNTSSCLPHVTYLLGSEQLLMKAWRKIEKLVAILHWWIIFFMAHTENKENLPLQYLATFLTAFLESTNRFVPLNYLLNST